MGTSSHEPRTVAATNSSGVSAWPAPACLAEESSSTTAPKLAIAPNVTTISTAIALSPWPDATRCRWPRSARHIITLIATR